MTEQLKEIQSFIKNQNKNSSSFDDVSCESCARNLGKSYSYNPNLSPYLSPIFTLAKSSLSNILSWFEFIIQIEEYLTLQIFFVPINICLSLPFATKIHSSITVTVVFLQI